MPMPALTALRLMRGRWWFKQPLSNLPACTTTTAAAAAAAAVLPWSASFCAHSCAVQQSHASTLCDWLCVLPLVHSLARCSRLFLQLKEECVALRTHVWEEVGKAQECLCRTVDGDGCEVWVW
jgi:hypothetical protein